MDADQIMYLKLVKDAAPGLKAYPLGRVHLSTTHLLEGWLYYQVDYVGTNPNILLENHVIASEIARLDRLGQPWRENPVELDILIGKIQTVCKKIAVENF